MRRRSQATTDAIPGKQVDSSVERCKHAKITPYGDGKWGKCEACGDDTFPIVDPGEELEGGVELDEGDEITVSAGRELFAPIRFHSFEVGPFSVKTRIRSGESRHDAIRRARATVDVLFAQEFDRKLAEHLNRIKAAGAAAMEARIVVK